MIVDPEPLSVRARALAGPVVVQQWWRDLTFVHWAVEPERVARYLPPGVRPDVVDGVTYVGLIPFLMDEVAFARGPALPLAGTFCETNVRLYSVDRTGRRGVVFVSLDAASLLFVLGTRALLDLPYRWATMRHRTTTGADGRAEHRYVTTLRGPHRHVRSIVTTRVLDPVEPTDLDVFLTARWGLHVHRAGRTWFMPNSHDPWTVHAAQVEVDDDLVAHAGLAGVAAREPDHVRFSPGVHTVFGTPVPADRP